MKTLLNSIDDTGTSSHSDRFKGRTGDITILSQLLTNGLSFSKKGMTVVNVFGKEFSLGNPIFEGEEGGIYENPSDPETVIKIYRSTTPEKVSKLGVLLKIGVRADERLHQRMAWPLQGIFTKGGECVGYLMRKVPREPVHSFINPKERMDKHPEFSWMNLVQAAKNAAAAFHFIHSVGAVMGDVNESNFVVDVKSGMASLINCDGYQVTLDGKTFRCQVGVGGYRPPELRGINIGSIDLTINHDLFGLALMIYQLLFIGHHPFTSDAESYDSIKSRGLILPTNSLQKQDVTAEVFGLFEQAFLGEIARPSAEQWFIALTEMERQLTECINNPLHYHLANHECPYCRLDRAGVSVFKFKEPAVNQSDIELYAKIKNIPVLQLPPYLPLIHPQGKPIPKGVSRLSSGMLITWLVIVAVAIGCFALIGPYGLPISIVLGRLIMDLVRYVVKFSSPFEELKKRRFVALSQAEVTVTASLVDLNTLFAEKAAGIESLKGEGDIYYKRLQEIAIRVTQSAGNPSPLDLQDRSLLQIDLKNVYVKAQRNFQEAAVEIARIDGEYLRQRGAFLQAEADFQVMIQAEKKSGIFDLQFRSVNLFLLLVMGALIFSVWLSSGTVPAKKDLRKQLSSLHR